MAHRKFVSDPKNYLENLRLKAQRQFDWVGGQDNAHSLQDFDSNLNNSNSLRHYFHSSDIVYFLNNAGRSVDKVVRQFGHYFLFFAHFLIGALSSTVVSVSFMIG